MTIQQCTSSDHIGWVDLRVALWPHIEREEHMAEMRQLCAEPQRFVQFVAIDDGVPQGFIEAAIRSDYVNGTETSPVMFLEGVYVNPDARRRGIARALVNAVEEWARSRRLHEIASDANIGNHVSHALHNSLGYKETERVVYFRKLLSE